MKGVLMSKTEASKVAYNIRREIRLRRDKTAAQIMAALTGMRALSDLGTEEIHENAKLAVFMADTLLAELNRTFPEISDVLESAEASPK
jgi:hypothetical protein